MRRILFAALAAAAFIAGPAFAQSKLGGFYVGAHIGQTKAKDFCDGLAGTGISCDDSDTAWKILGGYQFNKNFAAELAYTDGGEVTASLGGLHESVKANLWEIVGVGSLPVVERFSVYGKLGLYRADVEDNTNFGFSADETSTDVTFGFGARYDITQNVAGRVEWQRYSDVGGGDIGKADVDVISVGVLWKF